MRYLAVAGVVLAISIGGCAYLGYEYRQAEREYLEIGRQGHIIEQAIHSHDPSISVYCTNDEHGKADIVIRGVFELKRQDRIIAWAKSAKTKNQIPGRVVISFQKEIPHSYEPDIIVREVEI